MYVNDIEYYFYIKGAEEVNITMFQLFLLLYADAITISRKQRRVCKTD